MWVPVVYGCVCVCVCIGTCMLVWCMVMCACVHVWGRRGRSRVVFGSVWGVCEVDDVCVCLCIMWGMIYVAEQRHIVVVWCSVV